MPNIDNLVAVAKRIAKAQGLLATITYEAYTGRDDNGDPEYDVYNPLTMDVVLAHGIRFVGQGAEQQMSTQQITILQPLTVNINDRFTLPDGSQPKALNVRAPEIESGRPLTEVWF